MTNRLSPIALLCGAAAFAAPATAYASSASQSGDLSISGAVRAQAEAISGQFRPGRPSDDFLVSLRTNLLVAWTPGPFELVAELVDARGYGQEENSPTTTSEVNALEPLQAYLRVAVQDGVHVRAGRFTMELGSTRLIARPDASNSPPGFTGVHGEAELGRAELAAFWTMPNLRLPADPESIRENSVELDRATDDYQFYGVHLVRGDLPLRVAVEGYAYRLSEEDSPRYPTRNRAFWTFGGRMFRAPSTGHFDFDVEAARQIGQARATTRASDLRDLDVDAAFAHAELGRKLPGRWSPRLSVHFDYGSGDDLDTGGTNERFDPLFGARRSDFGPTSLYGPLTRANLLSAAVKVEAKPSARTDGFVSYRVSWLAEAKDMFAATGLRDPAGLSGTFEGHQIEGRLRHWLVPDHLRIEAGAALLLHGDFMRHAPLGPADHTTRYAYASISASF